LAERIEAAGITFAYEDTGGEGPAVLFAHGLGGSSNCWLAQLEECRRRGWRGIAHDARGAGRTRIEGRGGVSRGSGWSGDEAAAMVPPGPYSVEGWAEDVTALLDALGIDRAALVGHSVGCMVAERAAVALGARVWALALCGGTSAWPPEAGPGFEQRAQLARDGRMDEIAAAVSATGLSEGARRRDPRLLGLMREMIAGGDPEGYAQSALATGGGSMADLETLECPVLAFCGAEDPVTPAEAARQIADAAERGMFAEIDGAAHWCMLEKPVEFNQVLFGFLEQQAPDREKPG
jgi:3-oxoadipate enol-lactonase